MPKPRTAPDLTPQPYRLLKTDLAAKLSPRSQGGITYVLLADTSDAPDLHLAVTANEGGGLWSREAIALSTLEAVLAAYGDQPFPTRALRDAMVGRSSNNPPFCLAVLKDLGLVRPAPGKAHQHVKAGDWQAFRMEWLAQPGEAVIYPEPAVEAGQGREVTSAAAPEAAASGASAEPVTFGRGRKRKQAPVEEPAIKAPDTAPCDETALDTDMTLPDSEVEHASAAHP